MTVRKSRFPQTNPTNQGDNPTVAITTQQSTNKKILDTLAKLADKRIGQDKILHQGTKIILPENMTSKEAVRTIVADIEANEKETQFSKVFKYRPWDGAHAFQQALLKLWGTAGVGQATFSMFGSTPPEMRTVEVGVDESIQVPWGRIAFEPLDATFTLTGAQDRDFGLLFAVYVECPKKYAPQVDAIFKLIEMELRDNSIYRGKVITGGTEPRFIDPYTVNADHVVYAEHVATQLNANLWSLIEHTEATRKAGLPLKRAVLLGGSYGVGKSLTGMLTAQKCAENGWTFILCRVQDDLGATLQFARLYGPAVVFFEDIDVIAGTGAPDKVSAILDLFDGIRAKGTELVIVPTTNHVESLHKGMLRPGRLDSIITMDALDHAAFVKLVKALVPGHLLDPDVDFDAIADAMHGYLPSFVKESVDRAVRYALARSGGNVDVLTTQDFVDAADGMRPQYELMTGANEHEEKDNLTVSLGRVISEHITATIAEGSVAILDSDGDPTGNRLGIDADA